MLKGRQTQALLSRLLAHDQDWRTRSADKETSFFIYIYILHVSGYLPNIQVGPLEPEQQLLVIPWLKKVAIHHFAL